MKRFIYILSIFLISICLSGCYEDLYYSSFEDYVERINEHSIGYSVYELDTPSYFLPSSTFIEDFEYIEGEYYFYEEDPIRPEKENPCITLLILRYSANEYSNAKNYMIENIQNYNDIVYEYENYNFYENSNFVNLKGIRNFPKHFTMACYNDENHTLIFLGFYGSYPGTDEIYKNDIENSWISFIDQYYSEYYNFSN